MLNMSHYLSETEIDVGYLPFILIEPRINSLLEIFCLQCHDIFALLSLVPCHVFRFGSAGLFPLDGLENQRISTSNLRKKPSTGQIARRVRDIDFKLDLLIDIDCNDLWAFPSFHFQQRDGVFAGAWCLIHRCVLFTCAFSTDQRIVQSAEGLICFISHKFKDYSFSLSNF